jgi:hypothetical protein
MSDYSGGGMGGGQDLRDAYLMVRKEGDELPDQEQARDRYDLATEKVAAGKSKPGPFERFKRWFSAKF